MIYRGKYFYRPNFVSHLPEIRGILSNKKFCLFNNLAPLGGFLTHLFCAIARDIGGFATNQETR
jgi:hypothetical protein